jgi:hypothetical protein
MNDLNEIFKRNTIRISLNKELGQQLELLLKDEVDISNINTSNKDDDQNNKTQRRRAQPQNNRNLNNRIQNNRNNPMNVSTPNMPNTSNRPNMPNTSNSRPNMPNIRSSHRFSLDINLEREYLSMITSNKIYYSLLKIY